MLNYIEIARIIYAIDELPKIGDKHEYYNARVFSIEAYQDEEHENYLFYRVLFGQSFNKGDIKYFDIEVDCCYFTYAIEKKNIFRAGERTQ